MNVTLELCNAIERTRFEEIPPDVIAEAKLCLLDWIGVTLGGAAQESLDLGSARRDPGGEIAGQIEEGPVRRFDGQEGGVAGVEVDVLGPVVEDAGGGGSLLDGDPQGGGAQVVERSDSGRLEARQQGDARQFALLHIGAGDGGVAVVLDGGADAQGGVGAALSGVIERDGDQGESLGSELVAEGGGDGAG